MKIIPVYSKVHGYKEVFVDDEHYQDLCQFNWYLTKPSKTFYAVRYPGITMHRTIMNISDSSLDVDHINHNGLDNRKINLRVCTRSENMQNLPVRGSSKFKGVCKHATNSRWVVRIKQKYKSYWCGTFPLTPCGELLAALAYDNKAIELFGDKAILNFK